MNLTTVITNSGRSAMLMQAFQSVRDACVPKIVIASAPVSARVKEAHIMARTLVSSTKIVALDPDPGCNAAWLAGVKAAHTEWVHILHDDDLMLPSFYSRLSAVYKPDIQFYLFDASAHNSDGTLAPHHHKLWDRAGGVYPCLAFRPTLLRQTHSTSPVSGVFRKSHLVSVLEEFENHCATNQQFQLRDKMQAGNDLLIWLRATELPGNFHYIKEPLVSYGNHLNSATISDQKSGKPALPTIYKALKKYWSASLQSPTRATHEDPPVPHTQPTPVVSDMDATGRVDRDTWHRLVAMTERPSHDAMFNVFHPGPTLWGPGAHGSDVRALQARLAQLDWYFGDVTGTYDSDTVTAVKGFQAKRQIPVTGNVDQRTLDRLDAMTTAPTHDAMHNIVPSPGALDARCLTGHVMCIDKTSSTLRWVVDGKVKQTMEARFGSTLNDTPTREGLFHVYLMDADHVSHLYGSSMPFAMFFSGGQAVHYSSDFATYGYAGASHGCVNIRDYDGIRWLFSQVHVGDKVVVYWS